MFVGLFHRPVCCWSSSDAVSQPVPIQRVQNDAILAATTPQVESVIEPPPPSVQSPTGSPRNRYPKRRVSFHDNVTVCTVSSDHDHLNVSSIHTIPLHEHDVCTENKHMRAGSHDLTAIIKHKVVPVVTSDDVSYSANHYDQKEQIENMRFDALLDSLDLDDSDSDEEYLQWKEETLRDLEYITSI